MAMQAHDEPTLVKRPNQKLVLTPHQETEFLRCAIDPVYFINNYCYIRHATKGKIPFKLFDYQRDLVMCYWKNRQVIAMCSRQLGKSETAASFMLWFATFQRDVSVLIAANNFRAATEIMDRIKFTYEELPDWLKAGVVTYNVQKIVFDNGSKIESATTTPSTGRGKSISLLYCLAGNTTVTVRNKATGVIEQISLANLHNRLGD
jgi:phage terminase large subunit-like protein